jgi:ATP-dependent helicase HepA
MVIQFVSTPDYGIGRLVEFQQDGKALVDFLTTPGSPPKRLVVENAKSIELQRGDRVWLSPVPGETPWTPGRIAAARHSTQPIYYVDLPNREYEEVDEQRVWPRWDNSLDDPVAMLVNHIGETPFLYMNRLGALSAITEQRSRIAGLTGMWTSVVELHEHQVEAARRILMDPVQRYLLADEVGLGKTVEAGFVIRQLLSQSTDSRVLVLVPDHLVTQWNYEIETKFFPNDFGPNRVTIKPHSSLAEIKEEFSLCVIDEVHRLVVHPDRGDFSQQETFAQVSTLCLNSPSVLLLTATPVRAGDLDYLAILHLLSPDTHPLDAIDEFKAKLTIRNSIAEAMIGFTPDIDPAFIEFITNDLIELIPNDEALHGLLHGINQATERGESAGELIAEVRSRISNKYRLHSRMIRNRRVGKLLVEFPVRGRLLEKRFEFSSNGTDTDENLSGLRDDIRNCSDSSSIQASLMAACLYQMCTGTWASDETRAFCELHLGHDSISRLTTAVLNDEVLDKRVTEVVHFIKSMRTEKGGTDTRKKVIFATSEEFANSLQVKFSETWGAVNVFRMDESTPSSVISDFQKSHGQTFLVCDSSVEEGVNLQFAEMVVLADLPYTTRQLEQRIGRFDRFSTEYEPVHLTVVSGDSMHEKIWMTHLQATKIFEGSVAGLQYALSDYETQLFSTWVQNGNDAAKAIADDTSQFVENELRELAKQDVLDSNEFSSRGEESFSRSLNKESRFVTNFETAVSSYARDLGLRLKRNENDALSLSSNSNSRHLISPRRAERFHPKQWGNPGSFHRDIAVDLRNCRLLGLGNPLIDAIADSLTSDDKGRIAARQLIDPQLAPGSAFPFFDFNFLIDADATQLRELSEMIEKPITSTLFRLAQSFPTIMCTRILDANFKNPHTKILDQVNSPYVSSDLDINLCGSGYPTFISLTSRYQWEALCRGAEEVARESVLDEQINTLITNRYSQLESLLSETRLQMTSRIEAGMEHPEVLEDHDEIATVLLEAISHPVVTLDSVRVTFLTGPNS